MSKMKISIYTRYPHIVLFLLCSFFSFFHHDISAQNILPDPKFSFLKPIKSLGIQHFGISEFNDNSTFWKVKEGSPDIIKLTKIVFDSIYNNFVEYEDTCMGLILYQKANDKVKVYTESATIKLDHTLKGKQGYEIGLDISFSDSISESIFLNISILSIFKFTIVNYDQNTML